VTAADLVRIRARANYPLRSIHLSDIAELLSEVVRLRQEVEDLRANSSRLTEILRHYRHVG